LFSVASIQEPYDIPIRSNDQRARITIGRERSVPISLDYQRAAKPTILFIVVAEH
jgi:hypothetical protein